MNITIDGPIPSKKNAYKQTASGRRFKDRELTKQIDAITWQILAQTGNIQPYTCPKIRVHMICSTYRPDADNMYTTLQDCLVQSGIIDNDNLKHVRDFHVTAEVQPGIDYTTIEIEEQ